MRGSYALVLTEDDHQTLATMLIGMYSRKYNPKLGKPSTFLTKSARLALKALATTRQRRSKRPAMIQPVLYALDKESRPESEQAESCIEDLDRQKALQSVRDALEWLEPRKAEAIRLRDFEGQRYATIAATMGLSKARVAALRSEGMEELKFFLSGATWDALGGDPNAD
jgi:RNA polymerase sigma factor (sigma-70 family)